MKKSSNLSLVLILILCVLIGLVIMSILSPLSLSPKDSPDILQSPDSAAGDSGTVLSEPFRQTGANSMRIDPKFTWSFRNFEKDAMPMTTISLTVRYADGMTETKQIDTVEGSCNAYDAPSSNATGGGIGADKYAQSEMIICYYAGFGRFYKVTQIAVPSENRNLNRYPVQRKEFEEGSPDYEPVDQPFETIAEM